MRVFPISTFQSSVEEICSSRAVHRKWVTCLEIISALDGFSRWEMHDSAAGGTEIASLSSQTSKRICISDKI